MPHDHRGFIAVIVEVSLPSTNTRYNHPVAPNLPPVNAARPPIRTLLLLTLAAAAAAQTTTPPVPDPAIAPTVVHHPHPHPAAATVTNDNLIVLDPAHGAADNGAVFPDKSLEKDIDLALSNRIADSLKAKGFTVVLTRTNSTDDVPADVRVDLANRSRPLACILVHAASGGHGVHLYTSALTPPSFTDPNLILPWDTAQYAALPQSLRLTNDLATALNGIRVPLVTGRASVSSIDSLTCPAVALEIAPISANGDINTPVTDANYQTRVADAVANAMVFWRGHAESNSAAQAAAVTQAATSKAATPESAAKAKPKPKPPALNPDGTPATPAPRPKPPAVNPDGTPVTPRPKPRPAASPDAPAATPPAAKKPAPIVRVTPPATTPPATGAPPSP